jgi:hypothetical protein
MYGIFFYVCHVYIFINYLDDWKTRKHKYKIVYAYIINKFGEKKKKKKKKKSEVKYGNFD